MVQYLDNVFNVLYILVTTCILLYLKDIAQLIVERTTIVNYILPQEMETASKSSLDTLEAFIQLFVDYLRKAKEPNKTGYAWVGFLILDTRWL